MSGYDRGDTLYLSATVLLGLGAVHHHHWLVVMSALTYAGALAVFWTRGIQP